MEREHLKALGVASPEKGNARFVDEGDDVQPHSVMFAPLDGGWTVYATDRLGRPFENTRRTFDAQTAAFDYMYECLKAHQHRPRANLFEAYRSIGVVGVFMSIATLATMFGWLWISPFVYSRAEVRKLYVDSDQRGEFIFPADRGLVVVAVCYLLATANMLVQAAIARRNPARHRRRTLGNAGFTALFAILTLVFMFIRFGEVENPLFWLPPILALVASVVAASAAVGSDDDVAGPEKAKTA